MSAAVVIARRAGADIDLVRAGALLHDIGRSRTHGVMHVIASVEILQERGMPERLIDLVRCHVGAGLEPEEARRLGLPEGKYLPETLEQKIVCHCDNLVDGSTIIDIDEAIEEFEAKGLEASSRRMVEMEEEISRLTGEPTGLILKESDPLRNLRGPCSDYAVQR
jgi:uncharacterized protein (TIGR00295 family)